jgi:hypothetical protein
VGRAKQSNDRVIRGISAIWLPVPDWAEPSRFAATISA